MRRVKKTIVCIGVTGVLMVRTCGLGAICDVQVSGYVVQRADSLAFTCSLSEAPLFTLKDPRGLVTALNKPVVLHGLLERYPVHRRPSVRVCRIEAASFQGGDLFPCPPRRSALCPVAMHC